MSVILSRPGRSGEDEPGVEAIGGCVHKRRALNTQLSSGTGTSAGTFACPAGPYRNCRGEARTKKRTKVVFCTSSKKGSQSRSSRFEPQISFISFSRGSCPPFSERELFTCTITVFFFWRDFFWRDFIILLTVT